MRLSTFHFGHAALRLAHFSQKRLISSPGQAHPEDASPVVLLAIHSSRSASRGKRIPTGPGWLWGLLFLLAGLPVAFGAEPADVSESSEPLATASQTIAAVESATYTANLHDLEITAGEMTLEVACQGKAPGILDWTDVTIALSQLSWENQPLAAGTTPQQRMVVFTSRDHDRLTGKWSGHGQLISQKGVFDLVFPAALNTRVILRLAPDLIMESSQGILTPGAKLMNGKREWTLELGHINSTTLMVGPAEDFQRAVSPRYEIETEHRARRDGIFIKADLTIDGWMPNQTPLQLHVPAAVEIQSVTIFSGSVQAGATLAFTRDAGHPNLVTIPLKNLNLESRLTIRVRGFQPVTWGQPHLLPVISMASALETRRSVVIRVETPLQLQTVDVRGMLQTSLSGEGSSGEIWKYEAREADSSLKVVIDLPRSEIIAEMNCLADARRSSGWAAAVLSMHVENGSRFHATLQLPDDWKLVSVAAGDAESRLTSWSVDQRRLHVTWQNPMTPTSHRQLLLFARTSAWKAQAPVRLQIPQLRQAESVAVQYQVLLPTGMDLQIVEGESWRHNGNAPIATSLLRLREVAERLPEARSLSCVTLRSVNELREGRTLVMLTSTTPGGEALPAAPPLEQARQEPTSQNSAAQMPVPSEQAMEIPENSESADHSRQEPPSVVDPTATLQILTMVGPSLERGCVHHVDLQFNRLVAANRLNLKLPATCKVSGVEVDGRSVTVFRNGEEIPLPSELTTVNRLSLTYMTPPGTGWLYQTSQIPLPTTSYAVDGVSWTLDFPRDQRLAEIRIPGVLTVSQVEQQGARQYFGPLTRKTTDRIFNPISTKDWGELLDSNRTGNSSEPNRRTLQFLAPTAGASVTFITWDAAVTRHYAWVALLGCLMIGAAARLFKLEWLRRVAALWLISLFVATLVTSSAWTLIVGGMFIGSLLSLLVPRSWMQNRDFLKPSSSQNSAARSLVTTTAILLGLALLRIPAISLAAEENASAPTASAIPMADSSPTSKTKSSSRSDSPGTAKPEAAKTSEPQASKQKEVSAEKPEDSPKAENVLDSAVEKGYPPYLIESARYELIRLTPTPRLRAKLVVQARPHAEEIFVRLPLQEIILPPTAECLVNGKKKTLIPSVSGDAIMVGLNPPDAGSRKDAAESGWIRSEIQLDFMIRTSGSPSEMEPILISFQAIVPSVLDSTLKVPAQLLFFPFGRWGEVVSQGAESALLSLGGIGKIRSNFQVSGPVDALGASAITTLDVTPLRFKGQTRILPGPQGWPSQLPLSFPAGCVISSVSGNSLTDFINAPADPAATSLTLRLRKGLPTAPVVINFELPGGPQNPTELTIPPFVLWKGVNMVHSLGISGPPTTALSLVKTPGVVPLSPEEWPAEGDAGRPRPALAVMLNSPQQVQLSWSQLNPVRTATIAEELTIQRNQIEWNARIQMNVSQMTTFIHQFQIDPALRIESVTSEGTGSDSNIRHSRAGNVLSIFIPGGQLGDRTYQISGKMPLVVDAWTPVPSMEALSATVADVSLTILDRTGWNVELESAPGVPIDLSSKTANAATSEAGRTVGVFRRDTGSRPQRFRIVMPPDATRADSVLMLEPGTEFWNIVTTFHLTALEASLKKAVFRIPREMTGIQIRPSLFQFTTSSDEQGTVVTVKIPERYSGSATMTIAARIKPPLTEETNKGAEVDRNRESFPLIEVLSAQKTSQFVLVDAKSPVVPAPTGSLRIDAAAFPAWAPLEWVRAVKDRSLICYQQIRKDLTIVSKATSDQSGQPIVQLEETVIWPQSKGGNRGLTRLWMTAKDDASFRIIHGPEVTIQTITTAANEAINWSPIETGAELELPRQKAISGIVVQWSRTPQNDEIVLLQYDQQASPGRLLGIACPDDWEFVPNSAQPQERIQIWLFRWEALLECLREASGPVSVDSPLLKNIRQCQTQIRELLNQPGLLDQATRLEEYRRLSSEWGELKNDLVISGDQPAVGEATFSAAFTELLTQGESGLQMDWMVPSSSFNLGQLSEQASLDNRQGLIWYGLLAVLALGGVLRLSRRLTQLREFFGRRPLWSLTVLGLIWWLCLAPSVAGVLVIVLAWSWGLGSWLRGLWKHFRSRASVPA